MIKRPKPYKLKVSLKSALSNGLLDGAHIETYGQKAEHFWILGK